MKHFAAFLLAASVASAYITPPDQVLIEGRILLTDSRPLATFPWQGQHPRLSEHPTEQVSDSRELEALWEIREGALYLLAVSAFSFDDLAPRRSLGMHDLLPQRIRDGKVLAAWFTGEFRVLERERVDSRLLLRPEGAPPLRVVVRKFRVTNGMVTEAPNVPSESVPATEAPKGTEKVEPHLAP